MQFGLDDLIVSQIKMVFQQFTEIQEAIIYGSRVKGNYKKGSDIDITFKGSEVNVNTLNKVELALDALYLPYIFDLSIYHQIQNPDFLLHIDRVGQVLYKK